MTYQAIYKCRLCGQKFNNGVMMGELDECKREVAMDILEHPIRVTVHECFGGSIGIADFQGYEVADD